MEFRKATQEDMAFVRLDPFEVAVKDYHYMEVPDDNCFTGIFESEIVGVGGLHIKWYGVGELWLMLTADCKKRGLHGVLALEGIKGKMEEMLLNNHIHLALATVRTDFSAAVKMIEYFGFVRKCTIEQYCPDKGDVYLYTKAI